MAWFRAGGGGIPSSLKSDMNDVFNKKFGTVLQNYPPEDWPGTVNLMGPLPEKTVSGSVVAFADGADAVLLKSCAVTIAPTLDGVSSVDVVSAGKNLFDKANPNVVSGYIDTSSFNTGNTNAKTVYIPIKGGETYTVSKTAGQRFWIATSEVIPSSGALYTNRKVGNTASSIYVTAGDNDKYLWAWVFMQGTDTGTLEDMLASVQIEVGSTATDYAPYVSTTHTANIGRTIYGGEVDVVNGTGTETWRKIVIDGDTVKCNGIYGANGNALPRLIMDAEYYHSGVATDILSTYLTPSSTVINDEDSIALVSSGTSIAVHIGTIQGNDGTHGYNSSAELLAAANAYLQSHNLTVVYKLSDANATDFTFTPVPILSRLGDNTMWGDGDLSVTYRRDIALALAQ